MEPQRKWIADSRVYDDFKEFVPEVVVLEQDQIPTHMVEMQEIRFVRKTFIGHQPQLQDWLAVLDKVRYFINGLGELGEFKNREWDTIECGEILCKFNLQTGQPATESDYQAICEILSIT